MNLLRQSMNSPNDWANWATRLVFRGIRASSGEAEFLGNLTLVVAELAKSLGAGELNSAAAEFLGNPATDS